MKASLRKWPRATNGFTLVELMIVVAIIALLASVAVPGFLRSRKRAQAVSIRKDLALIDSAMDQYALQYGKGGNATITVAMWKLYLKDGTRLYSTGADIFGNVYGDQTLGVLPKVPASSYDDLADVADASYWAPYLRAP